MKQTALMLLLFALLTLLVACGGTPPAGSVNNPNTVKLIGSTFATTHIAITKGSTIAFVDDADNGALHILVVGQNGQQSVETGSADFGGTSGQRVDVGATWTTPSWNTAGTYHITCTVHPLMNLTVTVS